MPLVEMETSCDPGLGESECTAGRTDVLIASNSSIGWLQRVQKISKRPPKCVVGHFL